ncbi:MAG: hypothetical protein EOP05_11355 [Proteobacteria bacterium]|nr:MAG: hypothetical protein EOP05_11355 [Pseudomonadota bacterium]
MRKLSALVLISTSLTVGLLNSSARAQTPPAYLTPSMMEEELRFGPEWTLTSDELLESYPTGGSPVVTTSYSRKMVNGMEKALRAQYRGFKNPPTFTNKKFHSHWDRQAFTVTYPNQFSLTVFSDPGVLEINSSPSSQNFIQKNIGRIQRDIFATGKTLGLEPGSFAGSGHMHIEISKLHPDTVRNFLADYYNHTGLAAGALNEDVFNSIGPGEMPEKNKAVLRNAFVNYDGNRKRGLKFLIEQIHKSYEIRRDDEIEDYRKSDRKTRPKKYFAVSFQSFATLGTIEIRAIRPQTNAHSYLKLMKLWVARMKLADQQRELGYLVPIGKMKSLRGDPQAVLADFDAYVSDAGLNFADYREFVLPWWQDEGGEFDQYLEAKAAKAPKVCSALFH